MTTTTAESSSRVGRGGVDTVDLRTSKCQVFRCGYHPITDDTLMRGGAATSPLQQSEQVAWLNTPSVRGKSMDHSLCSLGAGACTTAAAAPAVAGPAHAVRPAVKFSNPTSATSVAYRSFTSTSSRFCSSYATAACFAGAAKTGGGARETSADHLFHSTRLLHALCT